MNKSISNINQVIVQDYERLKSCYPGLQLFHQEDGSAILTGWINFTASHNKICIEDKYLIELLIPSNYPLSVPFSKEIGGRIPDDFHKLINNYLCLGVSLAVNIKFKENPCLIHYLNKLLIPYLYAYSFYEKYGEMPYGEAGHNDDEIFYYYTNELFHGYEDYVIIDFIGILSGRYRRNSNIPCTRGHIPCPCGSGLNLRRCHGLFLRDISKKQSQISFLYDYISVFRSIKKRNPGIENKVTKSYWTPIPYKKELQRTHGLTNEKYKKFHSD